MLEFSRKEEGFTLIESAIVIMILSFILIPLFHFMNEQEIQKREYQAERKKERIVAAIDQFFKANRRYPCPVIAGAGANINNANFGQEAANCNPGASGVARGGLPVKSLELPWEYATNSYGWFYSYQVTDDLTVSPNFAGAITINDGVNNFATNIHYVVVDPGKDGKGSRNIHGGGAISPIPCSTSLDAENCDNDAVFTDAPIADNISQSAAGYYDDKLFYSLANENNAMWVVKESGSFDNNRLDIINRNDGMIGVGFSDALGNITTKPGEKLHIRGGTGDIEGLGAQVHGEIKVQNNITAGNDVDADNDVRASGDVEAASFCYGAVAC